MTKDLYDENVFEVQAGMAYPSFKKFNLNLPQKFD